MFDTRKFYKAHRIAHIDSGHHHCRAGWLQSACPFCGSKNWHFGASLTEERFNCYLCGPHSLWSAIGAFLRTNDKQAIVNCIREFSGLKTALPSRQKPRQKVLAPPPGTGPLQAAHRNYLQSRHFDPDQLIEQWGLRATAHTGDKWGWRVIAPIQENNRTVAFQGRAIGPHNPQRYHTTPDAQWLTDPHAALYGIDQADGNSVIVVEGVTGVWRLGPGTVATLGIGWHKQQANRLRKYKKRWIVFDPEPLAQKRALGLANHLALFGGETEIISGLATDPAELGEETAKMIRELAGI